MRGRAVLDTSVVIKWFRQGEVLADQALRLRASYLSGEVEIVLPSLVAYEFTNVLRYKADLTLDQVQSAVGSLLGMKLWWLLPSVEVLCRAADMARTYDITVYDGAFAALAESVSATYVTADKRLAIKLAELPYVRYLNEAAR